MKSGRDIKSQAVPDPPPGYQAQVDLGTIVLEDTRGDLIRVYAIAMVLSKSRYKYIEWYDKSPTTADFISFHDRHSDILRVCRKK